MIIFRTVAQALRTIAADPRHLGAQIGFFAVLQVLEYVRRYTHWIAIANQRLLSLDEQQVRFRYTDDRRPGTSRQKTLVAATAFIRRVAAC